MKDLRFRGVIEGVSIDVTYRTDLINESSQNFTVMQITTNHSFSPNDINDAQLGKLTGIDAGFRQLPSNLGAFKAFASTNHLDLYIMNSDGSGHTTLVDGSLSISESH